MRIFEKDDKTNYVDDNNVFVGFDNNSRCCENWGHYITRSIPKMPEGKAYTGWEPEDIVEDFDGFNFDTEFFQEIPEADLYVNDGGAVVFRLVRDGEEIFLTIYNTHNGYYSHGFTFENGATTIQEGSL